MNRGASADRQSGGVLAVVAEKVAHREALELPLLATLNGSTRGVACAG